MGLEFKLCITKLDPQCWFRLFLESGSMEPRDYHSIFGKFERFSVLVIFSDHYSWVINGKIIDYAKIASASAKVIKNSNPMFYKKKFSDSIYIKDTNKCH